MSIKSFNYIEQIAPGSAYFKPPKNVKVFNNKAYMAYTKKDENNNWQIYLITCNLDGSDFIEYKLTDLPNDPVNMTYIYVEKIDIDNNGTVYFSGNARYYSSGNHYIWFTGSCNIDGSNFRYDIRYTQDPGYDQEVNPTISMDNVKVLDSGLVQFSLSKYRYYYVGQPYTYYYDMYLCTMNPDGTGWTESYVATQPFNVNGGRPRVALYTEDRVYWMMLLPDSNYRRQLNLGYCNYDGSAFSGFQKLTDANVSLGEYYKEPYFCINGTTIIISWPIETNDEKSQLWLITVDLDLTTWTNLKIKERQNIEQYLEDYTLEDYTVYNFFVVFIVDGVTYYTYYETGYVFEEQYIDGQWVEVRYERHATSYMGYLSSEGTIMQSLNTDALLGNLVFDPLYVNFVGFGFENGIYCTGLIEIGIPDIKIPIILGPNPIRSARPTIMLKAPTPTDTSLLLLHFKLESFADADGSVLIATTNSSVNPELFEYSTDNGVTWSSFPSNGLPSEAFGALVKAPVEVGPRTKVWIKASVGA